MREILFRGKDIISSQWFYGNYSKRVLSDVDGDLILHKILPIDAAYSDSVSIKPDTLGQFTGLYDKNGTKIFEGDIVTNLVRVYYDSETASFKATYEGDTNNGCGLSLIRCKYLEVLGNIYDDPKLLNNNHD